MVCLVWNVGCMGILTGFGAIEVDVVALLFIILDLDWRDSAAGLSRH